MKDLQTTAKTVLAKIEPELETAKRLLASWENLDALVAHQWVLAFPVTLQTLGGKWDESIKGYRAKMESEVNATLWTKESAEKNRTIATNGMGEHPEIMHATEYYAKQVEMLSEGVEIWKEQLN